MCPIQKKSPTALKRLSIDAFRAKKKHPIALVLDNIRSAYNVGSAFRIGDAFLLECLYLCGITPTPPHPQIAKTALGAEKCVAWEHAPNTATLLQKLKANHHLVAVELATPSIPLSYLKATIDQAPCALIFGHEVFGISDEALHIAQSCVEIPQYGTKHSMNVAMSMSIVTWELLRN